MNNEYLVSAREKMDKAISNLVDRFTTVRAGRANPAMLNGIHVDYYGTPTALNSLANITVPEAKTLMIKPFDKSCLKDIVKAIQEANLGINPTDNGECVILTVPQLTEERRKELTKQVKAMAEDAKVAIRNIRREDIPDIVDIKINGWRKAYKGLISDDILNSLNEEQIIKKLEKNYTESGFIVAILNETIAGFCNYIDSNKYTQDMADIDCEILALYVKPELKYNGIGTKLFNYVLNVFKEKNKSKMLLWCLKENEPSKKFYEKMGGKILTTREFKIENENYIKEVDYESWMDRIDEILDGKEENDEIISIFGIFCSTLSFN